MHNTPLCHVIYSPMWHPAHFLIWKAIMGKCWKWAHRQEVDIDSRFTAQNRLSDSGCIRRKFALSPVEWCNAHQITTSKCLSYNENRHFWGPIWKNFWPNSFQVSQKSDAVSHGKQKVVKNMQQICRSWWLARFNDLIQLIAERPDAEFFESRLKYLNLSPLLRRPLQPPYPEELSVTKIWEILSRFACLTFKTFHSSLSSYLRKRCTPSPSQLISEFLIAPPAKNRLFSSKQISEIREQRKRFREVL